MNRSFHLFVGMLVLLASCSEGVPKDKAAKGLGLCLQKPLVSVDIGPSDDMKKEIRINESCILREEDERFPLFLQKGKLNAVLCFRSEEGCLEHEEFGVAFYYYVIPEMLFFIKKDSDYVGSVEGYKIYRINDRLVRLVPAGDDDYFVVCTEGEKGVLSRCSMRGGVYESRIAYSLYSLSNFNEQNWGDINRDLKKFIVEFASVKGD